MFQARLFGKLYAEEGEESKNNRTDEFTKQDNCSGLLSKVPSNGREILYNYKHPITAVRENLVLQVTIVCIVT